MSVRSVCCLQAGVIPVYETKRLLLRTADSGDIPAILAYLIRNRDFLRETEPARDDRYYTYDFQTTRIWHERRETEAGRLLKFWIMKQGDPEAMIGSISFNSIIRGAFQSCFLGYRLDHAEEGRGYMTEALERAIPVLFQEHCLHRIEANILPGNAPSLRVAEKLGFHREGVARKYLLVNGKWEDQIRMVLLNEEWGKDHRDIQGTGDEPVNDWCSLV